MTTPLCIYHANCMDGFTAAWVVRKALGEDVEFFAASYGTESPDVTGRDVIMVDFSYKRPVIEAMMARANTILILDHHVTAKDDLTPFRVEECGGGKFVWPDLVGMWRDFEELARPPIAALFDMNRSGAQITWDFFNPKLNRPLLVDYTGDRDLWRFELAFSREVNTFISAYDQEFLNWDYLNAMLHDMMSLQHVAELGGAMEKKHHKDIGEMVGASKRRMIIGGHDVPVANLPFTMSSDAGNLMCAGEPFAATYLDTPHGRAFSLRSTDAGLDVSEIAKTYGGGGHRNAAGFKRPLGWEGDR